ncbi:MAG: RHS repeat protein [Prevotellaceae bacterium]|jgi:YD repeat-containing protein|nr:RHS repeat protein [Prevotellaceae bacterium]
MKKFMVIMMSIGLLVSGVWGQIDLNGYFATPNVASLGIFNQIPVSMYTGVPQIDIPLYNLVIDGTKVPINLSYHTNFVKPRNVPSWIGLGWSLSSGGSITRIPKGRRDEIYPEPRNYENNYSMLNDDYWCELNEQEYNKYLTNCLYGCIDFEPDEFVFNFGNYSGSFYLNHFGEWQVRSSNGQVLKIETLPLKGIVSSTSIYIENPQCDFLPFRYEVYNSYYAFKVTTENGTQYIFGGGDKEEDGLIGSNGHFFPTNNYKESNHRTDNNTYNVNSIDILMGYVDTWHLREIITPNNESISFNYKRETALVTSYKQNTFEYKQSEYYTPISGYSFGPTSNSIPEISYLVQTPSYLKSIITDNCKIYFYSSQSNYLTYDLSIQNYINIPSKWIRLDSIKIQDRTGNYIKQYVMNYTSNNTERPKLLSIIQKGNSNNTQNIVHSFTYNQTKLPDYNTQKIDHWGFYNGHTYTSQNIYIDRSIVNANYLKAEILEQITYPTGGQAVFEYEPHIYSSYVKKPNTYGANYNLHYTLQDTVNILTGGLRIKKIKLLDSNQLTIKETNYYYVKNYLSGNTQSSGILAGKPEYFDMLKSNDKNFIYIFSDYNPGTLSFTNGSHITYSEVVEKVEGNGFSINTFTNFDTGEDYQDEITKYNIKTATQKDYPLSSKFFKRGKLLLRSDYSNNSKLLKKIINEYNTAHKQEYDCILQDVVQSEEYVRSFRMYNEYLQFANFMWLFPYKIYTGTHNLISETEIFYSTSGAELQKNVTTYSYNNYNLLSSIKIQKNNSDRQITKFIYPFELTAGDTYNSDTYKAMTDRNILSEYVKKYTYIDNSPIYQCTYCGGDTHPIGPVQHAPSNNNTGNMVRAYPYKVISGEYRKFAEYTGTSGKMYKPQGIYYLLNSFEAEPENIDDFWKQKMLITYSDYGKILTTQDTESGLSTIYLWGYNHQYPIIKIENATLTQIKELVDEKYWKAASKTFNSKDFARYGGEIYVQAYLLEKIYAGQLAELKLAKGTPVSVSFKFDGCTEIKTAEEFSKMSASLVQLPLANAAPPKNNGSTYLTINGLVAIDRQISVLDAAFIDPSLLQMEVLLSGTTDSTDEIKQMGNNLRGALSDARVWTYTYKPLVGITEIIDPQGISTYFEYDSFGRLINTKDADLKLLQEYQYNYQQLTNQ